MNTFKKLALSLFAVVLILSISFMLADINAEVDIIPAASAAEIIDSGECGENVTYTLDSEGTLTISGTGEMEDYNYSYYIYKAPWDSFRDNF